MADSEVSLYCYGHGQINGAWYQKTAIFQNVTKLFLTNQIKSVGLKTLKPTQSDRIKQSEDCDLKAD